jgi:uncharacterized protein YuzE
MITLSVDPGLGAAYIKFSDEQIVETVEVTPSVQVDMDATNTVVGIEFVSAAADLPIEVLESRFQFPRGIEVRMLSRIWPSFSYFSEGQGHAYVPPTLQLA